MNDRLLVKSTACEEGLVYRCTDEWDMSVAAGSRATRLDNGDLVCTFMVQTKLGSNDFKPMICRSEDGGRNWQDHRLIWPHLKKEWSIFGSVSRDHNGCLYFFGSRTPIENLGESFWDESNQGLKQNQLIWSRSEDNGQTWSDPNVIPMPIPGSAEAAGAMCITQSGRWICCYCPYNTFDPKITVDRNQVVVLRSDNQGQAWSHSSMLRFEKTDSGGAEAWVIQLSDGRLLGICWHVNLESNGEDLPNAFALSDDEGITWSETTSSQILGQSTALAPLDDGKALFIYNDRKQEPAGVWIAKVKPTENDLNVASKKLVWSAQQATQNDTDCNHNTWTDFAFGEPSVTVLQDETIFVTLWFIHSDGNDIRYVRLPALS